MRSGDISDSPFCVGAAIAKDLPDVEGTERTMGPGVALRKFKRRPWPDEIDVYSFPQGWGSTALGFGGIGGQSMTTAQTTVVICGSDAAVYFGRRLAYVVQSFNLALMRDVASWSMAALGFQHKYRDKTSKCPTCGGAAKLIEKRPNGNTTCVNGHVHPSSEF